MKQIIHFISAFLLIIAGQALQSQHIVPASGIFHQNHTGSVSFIIGDLVTTANSGTNSGTQAFLTPAVQQTNLAITRVRTLPDVDHGISVYPNPANEFILLKTGRDKIAGMNYQLYDSYGKLIRKGPLEGNETSVSFSGLPPSGYYIKVMEGKKVVETFKIVKY